jgi:hypothetical protein
MAKPFISIIDIRPNTNVEFFSPSPEWREYMKNNFRLPGLVVGIPTEELSEDQLIKTTTVTFASPEAFAAYENDELVKGGFTTITDYNDTYDIIRTVSRGFVE